MKKIPSPAELYRVISKNRQKQHDEELWYSRYFGRKISIYFTWFFLHTPLTPNMITFLSTLLAILGGLFLAIPNIFSLLIGVTLFQLYMILDSTDGEVARFKNQRSALGGYLDQVMHVVAYVALFTGLGLNVYLRTKSDVGLFLGFGTSLIYTLASFVHYLDPLLRSDTYKNAYLKMRSDQSGFIRIANNIYNIITGDIEIALFLLLVAPLQYYGLLKIDVFASILIVNSLILFMGGILYNLYKKIKDERYRIY